MTIIVSESCERIFTWKIYKADNIRKLNPNNPDSYLGIHLGSDTKTGVIRLFESKSPELRKLLHPVPL